MEYSNRQMNNFLSLLGYSVHGGEKPRLDAPNWDEILEIAEFQSVLPLICEAASDDAGFQSNKKYKEKLFDSLRLAAEQDARTEAFLRLYRAFSKENLYPVVVKGIICREMYGAKKSFRPSGDEDLIIRFEEFDDVQRVLTDNGYEMVIDKEDDLSQYKGKAFYDKLQYAQEVTYHNEQEDFSIEVHINPFGTRNELNRKMNSFFDTVFDNAVWSSVDGVEIKTPNDTDHLLFLILHSFKHFIYSGFGVRMALDIFLFMEKYGARCDMESIYEKLETVNADKFFSDMLFIANNDLGFQLPLWKKESAPDELLEDMLKSGTFGNENDERAMAAVIATAAVKHSEASGKSSKAGRAWRTVFPGKEWLYSTNPKVKDKPILAVPTYLQRIKKGLRMVAHQKKGFTDESLKLSRQRVALFKKYDII